MNNSNYVEKKTVYVVGAGVSGMTCAHILKRNKNLNVVIFEASNNFGGRIRSLKGFSERDIELGGEEIHGDNSLYYKLASEAGANIFHYWEENTFYSYYKGEYGEIESLSEKFKDFKYIWDLFEEVSYKRQIEYPDIPVKQYLKKNNLPDDLDFLANAMFAVECGTDLENLSLKGFSDVCKKWQAGDENYLINNMSHSEILKRAYSDILKDIRYNTQIKTVDYEGEKIDLYDQDNNRYSCDICIMTVPITQIKKINFLPIFPQERLNAISKIDMDNVAKLVLKFKKSFWPDNCSWLLIPGAINVFWPVTQGIKTNENILTGMTSGKNARELNKLYVDNRDKFIELILTDIETYTKVNVKDIFVDFYWFDWKNVPFIEGGYSYPSVEEGNSRDILREPLLDRLFFAGEAYARNGHIATIHGAIETAYEVTENIQKIINSQK